MRKKKKYNRSYKEVFQDHINNKEEYIITKDLYTYIKVEYVDRIKNDNMCIEIEKARLDREINQGKIKSLPNYISYMLLSMTVLASGFITAFTQYTGKSYNRYILIVGFTIIFVAIILSTGLSTSKEFILDDKKVIVFKLSLRVLNDIEEEIAEELSKAKEKADKLEKQQKIEQYFSRGKFINNFAPAFNEIATGLVSKVFKKNK